MSTSNTCNDCGVTVTCKSPCDYQGHSHWVNGATRCGPCGEAFKEEIRIKRQREREDELAALAAHQYKADLDGHCPDDGVTCEACCCHEFDSSEGGMCLNCGKEPI